MLRRSFTGGLLIGGAVLAAGPPGAIAAVVRCGADGLGGVDFAGYVAAFNRGDFARLGEYYADNIDFQGRGGSFHSREEVLAFYRNARPRLQETLTILDAVSGPQGIVVDMLTQLQALADWPDFPTGALRKGDTRRSENFIWYEVADGKFTRIRSAHYGTVQPGRIADLVLLEANPLDDIANTRKITAVITDGRYLSLQDLEQLQTKLKQLAATK